MDTPTRKLSAYIKENKINLTEMSEKTGIPYYKLYYSLTGTRDRDLRAGEFLKVCRYIGKDAMEFAEEIDKKTKN